MTEQRAHFADYYYYISIVLVSLFVCLFVC